MTSHGASLVDGDPELDKIKDAFKRAKEATDALAKAMREQGEIIRQATNEVKRIKVRCSCGRYVRFIDLDLHNAKHAKEDPGG